VAFLARGVSRAWISLGLVDALLVIKEGCRERLSFANRVLGAGVEPAHLAALEPKSSVSAIPPPEQNL
jgi:hypothetical protein